ncbi:MAG: galactose oxidase [Crocinitomicaceae bacterium]|nr:galactose oxidase [Crocinitomicaceae bacterium]|tara:strand:- start:16772 stop:17983 length:1212 start_codon:yes stop_codon:yes gene_type:complete
MKHLIFLFLLISHSLIYAQANNTWTKKSDFTGLKRERAVSFTINNFGYLGTGVDTAEIVHNDFWKYDPTLDTWTQIADLPGSVRRNAIAFSINDKGYVGTGIDLVQASTPGAMTLNDFWEYDPTTNSWDQKANYPGGFGFGVYFATGFSIGSKGYVCCGKLGPNNYIDQLWEYKPSTDQWAQLPDFPGGVRYQLSSFVIGYNAYVGLGTDQDAYRKDIWAFSAATNQWTQCTDLPGSQRSAASTFTIGQRGYVCLGTNGGLLDDLWEYNPFNDSWSSKATYGGTPRKGACAFTANGRAYVGTGKGYSGKKASIHEYNPSQIINTKELDHNITCYPNPTKENIYLKTNSTKIKKIEIISLKGLKFHEEAYNSKINLQQIPSGTYLLNGLDGNNNIIGQQKIIIQ